MAKATTEKKTKTTKKTIKKTSTSTKSLTTKSTPQKEEENTFSVLSPLTLVKLWFEGWKKTFNLSGRSSRFEFWSFLLLNTILMVIIQLKCSYYMSERFLVNATASGLNITQIEQYINIAEIIFYLTIFIPLFPIVSLIVRRMHDLDKLAWPNYFEPLFMGVVVMSLLLVALIELNNTTYEYTAMMLAICFITLLYSVGFYGLKILSMTMFYQGNPKENKFGQSQYNEVEYEEQALNLSCLYFLFITTIGILYLSLALI